jgi:hypothetical protein
LAKYGPRCVRLERVDGAARMLRPLAVEAVVQEHCDEKHDRDLDQAAQKRAKHEHFSSCRMVGSPPGFGETVT